MRGAVLALSLTLAGAAATDAATDEAWEAFRDDVRAACRALAGDAGEVAVEVNPFGSESYGAALVTITTAGAVERHVCVFDKAAGAAEMTAPFAAPQD